ncbi:hypothetical protein JCGZ_16139 [Jatropha curcas]|uniref:Uncharacterized protein n=1 Tax=Jatropha curcas TaxID=180498 RepID=A0A067K3S2_JATCU|nr:hypothetical protein JCGZ_16139 [Jatropha curcas]
MTKSSSSSSSDSITDKKLQLLKKLTKKYKRQEMELKKSVMESSSGKEKSKSKLEKSKGKEKAKEKISASRGKGKSVLSLNPLMHSYEIDWKFFGKLEFNFRELFEVQGSTEFLSVNKPCYESVVKEFYGSLRVTGPEVFSMKIDGETRVLSYIDLSDIYKIPNKKGNLEEAQKEKGEEIEKEKGKEAESEKEREKEKGKEAKIETEAPQDKKDFVDLGNNEPETTRKDEEVVVEDANDAETEKLEISDEEEKEPETEVKKTQE